MSQQRQGMQALATTGVIGLHLVSGPMVGFAIGYFLDWWLGTSPWFKMIFLFIGIGAGFLNVWRDTQVLLNRLHMEKDYRRAPAQAPAANGGKNGAP